VVRRPDRHPDPGAVAAVEPQLHDLSVERPDRTALLEGMTARVNELANEPAGGLAFRADHFPFAKRGVPALLLMGIGGGHDMVEGGREAGDRWVAQFTADCYHQACDRWSADWDLRGAAQDVTLLDEDFRPVRGRKIGRDAAKFEKFLRDRMEGRAGTKDYGVENPVLEGTTAPATVDGAVPTSASWATQAAAGNVSTSITTSANNPMAIAMV